VVGGAPGGRGARRLRADPGGVCRALNILDLLSLAGLQISILDV
jgi:hypothetical protein